MKIIMEQWRSYLDEKRELFKKAKQIPYEFDCGLLNEQERNPRVATFDFDDTLRFSDTETATPIVQAMKDLISRGVEVYIVSSRRNDDENMEEIMAFVADNNLPLSQEEVYLTNFADKLPTLKELGSEMHFENDVEQVNTINDSEEKIKVMQVNPDTGILINF